MGNGPLDYSMWQWVGMSAVCGMACIASLSWFFAAARSARSTRIPIASESTCVFLFDGPHLSSTTASADALLSGQDSGDDWSCLRDSLIERFPQFPVHFSDFASSGQTMVEPGDPTDPWRVLIEPLGDTIRIELVPRDPSLQNKAVASFLHHGIAQELGQLQDIVQGAPHPIWKIDTQGQEIWHNAAYERLYHLAFGTAPDPAKPLFDDLPDAESATRRQTIALRGREDPGWYDVTSLRQDGGCILYASDVAQVVIAETTQRNFVQTLAKTFAQLSIGLAIFDRRMQLVLFNPALIDLTTLPADFLSARPNLLSFFDRLRDVRVMPEPKNYGSWREQMSSMVDAANDGNYCETWSLPSGSTYRVTGRPHPDGAVAFLFEDISAEIFLTRRFRADLELSQGILDEFDDAVAVFSASGILTMTNRSYRTLWKIDHEASFADMTVIDAMRDWQTIGGANALWGELRDFVLGREDRASWSAPLILSDGRSFTCSVHPVQSGATMISLSAMITAPITGKQPHECLSN